MKKVARKVCGLCEESLVYNSYADVYLCPSCLNIYRNKESEKKRKKKEFIRCIASFLCGALTWHILLLSFDTLLHRNGTLGGEVLVLPLLICVFYLGLMFRSDVEKMKGELKDEAL
ncbi:hypothetical protein [Caldicellulosiruptor hydrothermalis]|nr:hypothetical protein [Caldicellulosiruptor hydrothermalis]